MPHKKKFTIALLILFLVLPLISSFGADSDDYSVTSFHTGLSGQEASNSEYDATSTLTYQQTGGEGEGPGEFQGLSALSRHLGDTMVVFDFRLRRMSFFESDGRFGFSWPVGQRTGTRGSPRLAGVTHDGTLYVRFVRGMGSPNPGQPIRPPVVIFRYSGQGDVIDSLGAFPGLETVTLKLRSGAYISGPVLFGRNTFVHAAGEHLYVAANDSYRVDLYTDGVLDTSIRWPLELKKLLPNHIDDQRTERLSGAGSGRVRQAVEEQYELTPFPEKWPAFSALVVDQQGNVWTARSGPSSQSTTWDVFDPTGRWLGPVRLPTGLRITDIGDDYVLGVWRDVDDVEHVQLYDLIKPGQ